MKTIKYVAVNTHNNKPLYESASYIFLVKLINKLADKKSVKIYKKTITVETEEVED